MPHLIDLLFAYSLAFGFQNKAPWLYSKNAFLDALLGCAYCTGFHCGWLVWLGSWMVMGKLPVDGGPSAIIGSLLAWSFASAAACYMVDTGVRWCEGNTPMPPENMTTPEE